MKTTLTLTGLVAVLALVLAASPAMAQDKAKKGARAGVGMSIGSGIGGINAIHIPVLINPQFRVEPTLSFNRTSLGDNNGGSVTNTVTKAALGVFYNWKPAKTAKTNVYVGPRLGIVMDGSKVTPSMGDSTESDRQDFVGGLAFGGEYFFAKTFSIGGEVQLNYTETGDTETTAGGNTTTTSADSAGTDTNTIMTVRWYFL